MEDYRRNEKQEEILANAEWLWRGVEALLTKGREALEAQVDELDQDDAKRFLALAIAVIANNSLNYAREAVAQQNEALGRMFPDDAPLN